MTHIVKNWQIKSSSVQDNFTGVGGRLTRTDARVGVGRGVSFALMFSTSVSGAQTMQVVSTGVLFVPGLADTVRGSDVLVITTI